MPPGVAFEAIPLAALYSSEAAPHKPRFRVSMGRRNSKNRRVNGKAMGREREWEVKILPLAGMAGGSSPTGKADEPTAASMPTVSR